MALEAFGKEKESGTLRKSQNAVQIEEPTATSLIVNTSGDNGCLFCGRPHPSYNCQKIADLSYEERKSQVMRKGCCLVCLKPGHMARRCRKKEVRCLICSLRHYALLCPDLRNGSSLLIKNKEAEDQKVLLTNLPCEKEIYLKTIMLKLRNRDREVCVRALIDDGSQRSYLEKSLAEELNLRPTGIEVFTQELFGDGMSPACKHKRYMVTVKSISNKYSTSLALLDQPKICSTIPRIRDGGILKELRSRGEDINDVGIETPPIRVLLGADVIGCILTGRVKVFKTGISAIETLFEWTVLRLGERKEVSSTASLCLENLQMQKMWDYDTLGIIDPIED